MASKKRGNFTEIFDRQDKSVTIAFTLACFGILLFIALALTLP